MEFLDSPVIFESPRIKERLIIAPTTKISTDNSSNRHTFKGQLSANSTPLNNQVFLDFAIKDLVETIEQIKNRRKNQLEESQKEARVQFQKLLKNHSLQMEVFEKGDEFSFPNFLEIRPSSNTIIKAKIIPDKRMIQTPPIDSGKKKLIEQQKREIMKLDSETKKLQAEIISDFESEVFPSQQKLQDLLSEYNSFSETEHLLTSKVEEILKLSSSYERMDCPARVRKIDNFQ